MSSSTKRRSPSIGLMLTAAISLSFDAGSQGALSKETETITSAGDKYLVSVFRPKNNGRSLPKTIASRFKKSRGRRGSVKFNAGDEYEHENLVRFDKSSGSYIYNYGSVFINFGVNKPSMPKNKDIIVKGVKASEDKSNEPEYCFIGFANFKNLSKDPSGTVFIQGKEDEFLIHGEKFYFTLKRITHTYW